VLRFVRAAITQSSETAEARPRGAAPSAVSIMTIHKSKGLDFREVFVVGLQRPGLGTKALRNETRIEREAHVLFGAPSPDWFAHKERVRARDAAERVRLLYVAMTRAKDRLVLSGILPAPLKDGGPRSPTALLHLLEQRLPADARTHLEASTADTPACEIDGIAYRVTAETDLEPSRSEDDLRVDAARVQSDSDRLAAARPIAHARASAGLVVPMSRRAVIDDEESEDGVAATIARSRTPAGVAAVAGTAIHEALEVVALGGDIATSMRAVRESLGARVAQIVAGTAEEDPELVREALVLAQSVHDAFVSGPAFAHFSAVAPHVLARELPIVAQVEQGDGLITLANGAIDLVYRDARTNELVVVDYKTGPEPTDSAHRAQLNAYRRALKDALALDRMPRGELWYLASSRVTVVT
jgi:ATP-dependent exoDNAse (exonuclease V) beta subunit